MSTLPDLSGLLESIRQGNEIAFQKLYELTKTQVFNTAISYVQSREDAEEITQDVFVQVFHSINEFNTEAAITTWIYRITINKCLDFLKRRKRQKRFAFLTSLFDANSGDILHHPTDFFHPGIALENKENSATLFSAIESLPEKQKTAYILTRIEGLTNIETANVMNVTVGAVESLIQRANENLRKQLASLYKSMIKSR